MLSFSAKVKNEISSIEIKNVKDAYQQLCGMMIFGGKIKENIFYISYENKKIATKFSNLFELVYPNIPIKSKILNSKKNSYCFEINLSKETKEEIMNYSKKCLNTNLKFFVSGVFLSCASITDPKVDYHLEFNLSSKELCNILINTFISIKYLDFNPKIIKRRQKSYTVYIKGHEKIEDFLAFVGANSCAMEFMQVKMVKEVRNNINRNINFETANLSKITMSSSNHVKAIKKIINSKKLSSLPENLKETAILRLNNPYISLKELSLLHKKPVTKSGVNHRLKKILEISENL